MKKPVIALALTAAVTLSACTELQEKPGETIGTIIGIGVGALLGSKVGDGSGQLVATAVGAIAGQWIGSEIGKALDERDWEMASANAQDTLENGESGETGSWSNPDTGNAGSIRPVNHVTADSGEECRDFESSVVVDGKTEVATGRACRQDDGSWLIVQ